MKQAVTAIFDIGKTNKKFFLFDTNYSEVYREYARFDEILDEDGYPTENLKSLVNWIGDVFSRILQSEKYEVTALNFSTYGASLVHLGENSEVLTPLYNYTKPLDPELINSFFEKYGPQTNFAMTTGSLNEGMLNSGMQLYWLKHRKPTTFKKIKYSLHLPQYISFSFTGTPVSEYTSIGCHTGLWDYNKKDYHTWVYEEGIAKILPPIVSSDTGYFKSFNGKKIKIGVGIHDSSAALLTYTRNSRSKFLLVSTGTWSITLNPFSNELLTKQDVTDNCSNYMQITGKPVKSARLFLGAEYSKQVKSLSKQFEVNEDYHKDIKFNLATYIEVSKKLEPILVGKTIETYGIKKKTKINYTSFEYAYHHLMIELVTLQIKSIQKAQGENSIEKLYIDGGFSDNDVYIKLLSYFLKNMELYSTDSSFGSALGAAMVISDGKLNSDFLEKNYGFKKQVPVLNK
ncbi:MAG: FGGY-family carbohydrate kinase [Maribacter sp.]